MNSCIVHLVRHAEHSQFGQTLSGRVAGVGLSEAGRTQAASLAWHYAGVDVRAVLTSPVQRARETAAAIGGVAGRSPMIEQGIEEVDFGAWAGRSFENLAGSEGWAAWNSARSLAPTPGGESMLSVQARAVHALSAQRAQGGTVIAVSHADVIKAVLAHVLGMSLDLLHRVEVGPASRSIVVLGEDFARVEAINLPP